MSLLGPFGWCQSPLCSLNVSLSPLWFLSNDTHWWPQELGFFGLLKVWAKWGGDVFLLLLDWALPDLKRKVEYSGSSHVPTPLGLAKKDKALSLYPSTLQA